MFCKTKIVTIIVLQHHLYTEEELGPAEEVESDRQQRVYRGQPATLGQVARDRDGLSRHSNALQVHTYYFDHYLSQQ